MLVAGCCVWNGLPEGGSEEELNLIISVRDNTATAGKLIYVPQANA